jgi:hypothetical protein
LNALNSGTSREDVLKGFIYSQEFIDLCWKYGILPNPVAAFVSRFYRQCLDRRPERAGLDDWTNALLDQVITGADVAREFINSTEFKAKNTTNEEYLDILYRAFFNREPDPAGWDFWLAELNTGKDRGYVLDGFLGSQEFSKLCETYGITPYRIIELILR